MIYFIHSITCSSFNFCICDIKLSKYRLNKKDHESRDGRQDNSNNLALQSTLRPDYFIQNTLTVANQLISGMHNDLKDSRQFLLDKALLTQSIANENEILKSKLNHAESELIKLYKVSTEQEEKIRLMDIDIIRREEEYTTTSESEIKRAAFEYNTHLVESSYL